jgi:hypothetical protein
MVGAAAYVASVRGGVETINFLKEERGPWLRKYWKFVLVSSLSVVIFLVFLH